MVILLECTYLDGVYIPRLRRSLSQLLNKAMSYCLLIIKWRYQSTDKDISPLHKVVNLKYNSPTIKSLERYVKCQTKMTK